MIVLRLYLHKIRSLWLLMLRVQLLLLFCQARGPLHEQQDCVIIWDFITIMFYNINIDELGIGQSSNDVCSGRMRLEQLRQLN
jgi:hypothetical protein